MSIITYLPFILLVTGIALLPGPNMMLYVSQTIAYGRKAGWLTVAGITSAFVVHITATVLGVTALLTEAPMVFSTIQVAGAAYLVFLAYKIWKAPPVQMLNFERVEQMPLLSFWVKGFVGNVLNPQTTILYFSLLPQFIKPEQGHFVQQNLTLGGIQMLCSTVTNVTVVYVVSKATGAINSNHRRQLIIRRIMAAILAIFALKLLWAKLP
ncbi:MAG: LysE family translocator [Chitinophagaceae bacterium]|uniref:LysE family translocator n=1 Tax=unclassified Paraflavitalea TaxID=2798305 RepID=UPI003D32F065|nr:LysE family translocator [Chitinophagaceae bacterium]